MYEKPLPFGEPVYFEGKYKEDKIYPLYIQMICCNFKIKKNKIPTIQIKSSNGYVSRFKQNEYLESSNNEWVTLVLTSVDLKLFLEQYDFIEEPKFIAGWKFKQIKGLFTDYIDKWTERKIQAGKEGNGRTKNNCKTYA